MKIPNKQNADRPSQLSLARIVSEDSQRGRRMVAGRIKSSKDS